MARLLSWLMGGLIAAVLVGLPWGYEAYRQKHFRNFRTVKPEVLYRSGQMTLAGLERVIHDYGIDLLLFTYDQSGEVENGEIRIQVKASESTPERQRPM